MGGVDSWGLGFYFILTSPAAIRLRCSVPVSANPSSVSAQPTGRRLVQQLYALPLGS